VLAEVLAGAYALINGEKPSDWQAILGMLNKSGFSVAELKNFDLGKLNNKTIDFCDQITKKYTIEQATKAFASLAGFYRWLQNMVRYWAVYKVVLPKQIKVRQ